MSARDRSSTAKAPHPATGFPSFIIVPPPHPSISTPDVRRPSPASGPAPSQPGPSSSTKPTSSPPVKLTPPSKSGPGSPAQATPSTPPSKRSKTGPSSFPTPAPSSPTYPPYLPTSETATAAPPIRTSRESKVPTQVQQDLRIAIRGEEDLVELVAICSEKLARVNKKQ